MEITYNIVPSKGKYRFIRKGNKKATRIYDTGFEMSQALGYYLLNNNDITIYVHNKDGTVSSIITSTTPDIYISRITDALTHKCKTDCSLQHSVSEGSTQAMVLTDRERNED